MEKNNPAQLIFYIHTMYQISRFRGLYELKKYLEVCFYEPLHKGLSMTLAGIDPSEVHSYYDGLIEAEQDSFIQKILRMIQRGIGLIASGQGSDLLRFQLSGMLGEVLAEETTKDVAALFLEYEKEKHTFFSSLEQTFYDPVLTGKIEAALLYEFAWSPGFITGMVPLEVLTESIRTCSIDIQMKVLHSLPVFEGRELMKIYRIGMQDQDSRVTAINLFLNKFKYLTS